MYCDVAPFTCELYNRASINYLKLVKALLVVSTVDFGVHRQSSNNSRCRKLFYLESDGLADHIGINSLWEVVPCSSVILKCSSNSSPGSPRGSTCTRAIELRILLWFKDIMRASGTCLKWVKKNTSSTDEKKAIPWSWKHIFVQNSHSSCFMNHLVVFVLNRHTWVISCSNRSLKFPSLGNSNLICRSFSMFREWKCLCSLWEEYSSPHETAWKLESRLRCSCCIIKPTLP